MVELPMRRNGHTINLPPFNRHLTPSPSPSRSRLSDRISAHAGSMTAKLMPPSEQPTIIHRPNLRPRPTLPHLNTNLDRDLRNRHHENGSVVIAHSSSSSPSRYGTNASPVSKPSTGQTSVFTNSNSTKSQRSVEIKAAQEQYRSPSRGFPSYMEELAPIEESDTQYLKIPCHEAPVAAKPSVTTVESVTAAKIFFETHFNPLMSDQPSPRSLRRKKLEQKL